MPTIRSRDGISTNTESVSDAAIELLLEAGAVLATSLDQTTTMGQVARLTVPRLADLCIIDLLDMDGSIRGVAVAATDEEVARGVEALRVEHPIDPEGGHPVARVIRSGEPVLLPEMTDMLLRSIAQGSEHARFMSDNYYRSIVVAPLLARERTLGTISVLRLGDSEPYGSGDLDLACELARRAALAIDNARLFTERSRIAGILERSLLPESLPEIPGVEIHARYTPAGVVNEVGGDFYDVFAYGDGRWVVAIGDVCGKGPHAAVVTALARHTLRAAALSGQRPAAMIDTLHRALRLQATSATPCTVCLVIVAPAADHARLTVTLGGHLPPLLIDRDGDTRPVGEPGTLLGAIDPIHVTEIATELREGQTLLLYTDGVPEAGRGGGQLGEQGLLELCAQAPQVTLGGLLGHIEHAAQEHARGRLRDDIALVAVRLSDAPAPSWRVRRND